MTFTGEYEQRIIGEVKEVDFQCNLNPKTTVTGKARQALVHTDNEREPGARREDQISGPLEGEETLTTTTRCLGCREKIMGRLPKETRLILHLENSEVHGCLGIISGTNIPPHRQAAAELVAKS
jgi:hypothetical protein